MDITIHSTFLPYDGIRWITVGTYAGILFATADTTSTNTSLRQPW